MVHELVATCPGQPKTNPEKVLACVLWNTTAERPPPVCHSALEAPSQQAAVSCTQKLQALGPSVLTPTMAYCKHKHHGLFLSVFQKIPGGFPEQPRKQKKKNKTRSSGPPPVLDTREREERERERHRVKKERKRERERARERKNERQRE